MTAPSFQLPDQMSTYAAEYDDLYYFIYWFSVVFFVGITATTLYFVMKYRRKPGDKIEKPLHIFKLELFWTFLPILIVIGLFHASFEVWVKAHVPAEDSMEIRVRGSKWKWDFEYPNGMRDASELRVPVNTPIKLVLSSEDVIHSFFVPSLRVKRDAVPGMYSTVYFEANKTGDTQVFCTEYCGTGHSAMLATLKIVSKEEFEDFLKKGAGPPDGATPAEWGKLLVQKNQCPTCHSQDGSPSPGPTFKGIWGREESIKGEGNVTVDENYVHESIVKPQAKIVSGYESVVMPPFTLTDAQIDAIIAYMKTLK